MSENNYDSCCLKSKLSWGGFTKLSQPVAGLHFVKDVNLSVEDHIKPLNFDKNNIP